MCDGAGYVPGEAEAQGVKESGFGNQIFLS